ncbi:SspB family protein [Entomobacter blattae]|uniref:Stringent starvation protein B n=1 Tax=Entomobacter blattae TaxID=2762277 RepID=A0A7H1NR16_9PROT|nr:ClpXP protease specificity-enhancing factor SspB [Entomobacter blattae]QNT78226.1 Stringent starvation protein B [Entomobacter blattae]
MTDDNGNDPTIPPFSHLPYEIWIENAHRYLVIQTLEYVAQYGLPGRHHFFISFRTDMPGVKIPQRLKSQYPQEMTIVLQHQFWDLKVDRKAQLFSVGLSFGGVGSTLMIPFNALVGFSDPHAELAMRFTHPSDLEDLDPENAGENDPESGDTLEGPHPLHPTKANPRQVMKVENIADMGETSQSHFHEPYNATPQEDPLPQKEAEIISLSAFRKKDNTPKPVPTEPQDPSE